MHLEEERRVWDGKKIVEIYKQTKGGGNEREAREFAGLMFWRAYTEWCLNPSEGRNKSARERNTVETDRFLTEWIDNEVHYLIGREERTTGKKPSNEGEYCKVRERVVYSAVKRAVVLFESWGGHSYPPVGSEDKRNLRSSLDTEPPNL